MRAVCAHGPALLLNPALYCAPQGVNDAPALKRADIGIAVHGATDAARAAADIVLTEEGLSVIIDAIFESRKIFQRMRNYIIYRIACTFQLLLFFWLAIIAVSPDGPFMYDSRYHRPGTTNVRGWGCGEEDGGRQRPSVKRVCPLSLRVCSRTSTTTSTTTSPPSRSRSSRSSSSRSSTTAA